MGEAIARGIFSGRYSVFECLAAIVIVQAVEGFWPAFALMVCAVMFNGLMQHVLGPKKEQTS